MVTSGQTSIKPVFVFDYGLTRWGTLGLAGVCLFIGVGSLLFQPPSVSGLIVWGGLGAYVVYAWLKTKSSTATVTRVSFYEDRIETEGDHLGDHRYSDVESVFVSGITKWGKITLKGGDRFIRIGPRPKTGKADDFYQWFAQKLEDSLPIGLPKGGVGSAYSASLSALILVPIVVFFLLFLGLLPFFGPMAATPAAMLGVSTLFILAFWIARKEDGRAAEFYGSGLTSAPNRDNFARRVLSKGARWIPIILLLEVAGTIAAAYLPFLPGESSHFLQLYQQAKQAEGTTVQGQFLGIFSNNLLVLMINFVPGWGPLTAAGATYNTAKVIEAITQNASYPLSKYFVFLFSLPHSWLELTAYAVGIFEALNLPYPSGQGVQAQTPRSLVSYVKEVVLFVALAVGVLATAGLFEALEPHLANPYVLWIPIFLALGVAGVLWKFQEARSSGVNQY